MCTLHRLVLDERQHAVAAAKPEQANLEERDEEVKENHNAQGSRLVFRRLDVHAIQIAGDTGDKYYINR